MCLINDLLFWNKTQWYHHVKNDCSDPTLEPSPSSQHLNSACAILQQRDGYWVGPALGVTTYRICWKINTHKRANKHGENISCEANYKAITQLCSSLSLLLCDSSLIVPQNTWDTKPDTRAIQFFKCYSLQPTENSIYPKMTLWGFSKDYLGDAAALWDTEKCEYKCGRSTAAFLEVGKYGSGIK